MNETGVASYQNNTVDGPVLNWMKISNVSDCNKRFVLSQKIELGGHNRINNVMMF